MKINKLLVSSIIIIALTLYCSSLALASNIAIPTGLGLPDPAGPGGSNPGESGIKVILLSFLNWALIVFVITSLIAFVITGLMYLFAMGNSQSELLKRAKDYFVYAIIALIITGSGLLIVNLVNNFLLGNL